MEQIFSAPNPYYPPGVPIPRYRANELPVPVLLAALGGMLGSALLLSSTVALRVHPKITRSDLGVLCWFVLCGSLHCFFEGYFVLNHPTLASSQHLFAQLWKEYALSDSRYLISDPFMLSVEAITTFVWGPLCFVCALSIIRNSPFRHPLQIIMCIAHLYGVALYYGTSSAETYYLGVSHSRPEVLYFWGYYVGFNIPWVIVPFCLLIESVGAISRGLRQLEEVKGRLEVFQKRLSDDQSKKDR